MKTTERKYAILFSDSAWRNFSTLPSDEMARVCRALEWLARRAVTGLPDDDRALRVCGIEGKYQRDKRNKLLRVKTLNVKPRGDVPSSIAEALACAAESCPPQQLEEKLTFEEDQAALSVLVESGESVAAVVNEAPLSWTPEEESGLLDADFSGLSDGGFAATAL